MIHAELGSLKVRRRRLRPFVDLGPFFLFFGVSGQDAGREQRMQARFDLEFYANIVTVTLSQALPAGRFRLDGLPDAANRRGWTARPGGSVTADLSDEALAELRQWLADRPGNAARTVQATPLPPG